MKALNLNKKESPVREKAKRPFLRAFTRAAAVVLVSGGLMVGCAGNNSNVRSDSTKQTQVAKAETTSSKESYRTIAEKTKEIQMYHEQEMELIEERERLIKERDEARAKKEEARAKKEAALKRAAEADKRAREHCSNARSILDEKQADCDKSGCDAETKDQLKKYWDRYYTQCAEFIAGFQVK